jgi:ribosome-binding protein aMBF1 (putative translation factor)
MFDSRESSRGRDQMPYDGCAAGSEERAAPTGGLLVVELARTLGEIRRARGLRQADVAALMGTSQSCVSDFERGKANPQFDFVARYAAAVGASLRVGVPDSELPILVASAWASRGPTIGLDSHTDPDSGGED